MMSEKLGQLSFWLFFVGFNVTFFPMHILGLRGMPRRVYTYQPDMHWTRLNQVESLGYILLFLSVCIFLANVFLSYRRGPISGSNPWSAGTLEWATASPPPSYNFLHLPTVNGREALWDAAPNQPIVTGLDVVLCICGLLIALSVFKQYGGEDELQPESGRRFFMAKLGVLLALISILLVIGQTLVVVILHATD